MESRFQEQLTELQSTYKTRLTHLSEIEPYWHTFQPPGGPVTAVLDGIKVEGKNYQATDRFCQSLWTRFGLNRSIFTIMDPGEVFSRLAERHPQALTVLTTIENRALALSARTSPRISPEMLTQLFDMPGIYNGVRGVQDLRLSAEGVIQTTHSLPDPEVQIHSEGFKYQFLFETPIDGYGSPVGYISLLRLICSNGLVAYRPAFRSIFKVGGEGNEQLVLSLYRIINSFANDEGCEALNQRIGKAMITAPSVSEYGALRGLLVNELRDKDDVVPVLDLLDTKLGSISHLYSVASVTDLDPKRARSMPMRGTLADVINICTEMATHYPERVKDPNKLHAWVGLLVQESYDLEDVKSLGEPRGDVAPRERYMTGVFKEAA